MINLKFKGILMNIRTYDQMSRNKSGSEKLRNYLSNAYNDFNKCFFVEKIALKTPNVVSLPPNLL